MLSKGRKMGLVEDLRDSDNEVEGRPGFGSASGNLYPQGYRMRIGAAHFGGGVGNRNNLQISGPFVSKLFPNHKPQIINILSAYILKYNSRLILSAFDINHGSR